MLISEGGVVVLMLDLADPDSNPHRQEASWVTLGQTPNLTHYRVVLRMKKHPFFILIPAVSQVLLGLWGCCKLLQGRGIPQWCNSHHGAVGTPCPTCHVPLPGWSRGSPVGLGRLLSANRGFSLHWGDLWKGRPSR